MYSFVTARKMPTPICSFVPQISSYLKQCKFMKIEPYVTLFPVEHIETNNSYTHALTYLSTFVCIPGKHVQSMFHTCFTVKQMSHIGCTYVTGHMCLTYVAAFSIHVFLWHLCVDFGVRLYHIWIRFCLHGAFLNLLTVFPSKLVIFGQNQRVPMWPGSAEFRANALDEICYYLYPFCS
jgi:hypothetical protein